ncbi:hypothetical protein GCM10022393_28930 [Aquimarina addita]|uniref:Dual-action HEIGH metallo-peptidase n=2 Tax=Aquimarina addita TaxID=870485 RepID=A0ABP6URU6_9FLAO
MLFFSSCSKSEEIDQTDSETLVKDEVPKDVLAKLETAHFSTSNAFLTTYQGSSVVAVEDMFLTLTQIDELAKEYSNPESLEKHYRTINLVEIPEDTRTLVVETVGDGLGTLGDTALDNVVDAYNDLNAEIRLRRLNTGESSANIDIAVTVFAEQPSDGTIVLGRSAGFPSNGNPASSFGINSVAIELLNTTTTELSNTMAHEIGHAIGFRHTDFATRESCPPSSQGNEGSAFVGAIYIDGSPTGSDITSLMQACAGGNTTGNIFNENDVNAFREVY